MVPARGGGVVSLRARFAVIPAGYRPGPGPGHYTVRSTGEIGVTAYDGGIGFGYRQIMYSPVMDADLEPPLIRRLAAHRFTGPQLVAIDGAVIALVVVGVEFFMTRRAPRVSGTGWDAAGWTAYLVAAAATLFRRRNPRLALAVVVPLCVAALVLRAGGPTVFLAALTVYSVVPVSPRRVATAVSAAVAGAVLAATLAGGGQQVAQVALSGVALILLGWLAGENTRASRLYAAARAERAAERKATAAAEQAEQVSRALAGERAHIARDLHTSWPTR